MYFGTFNTWVWDKFLTVSNSHYGLARFSEYQDRKYSSFFSFGLTIVCSWSISEYLQRNGLMSSFKSHIDLSHLQLNNRCDPKTHKSSREWPSQDWPKNWESLRCYVKIFDLVRRLHTTSPKQCDKESLRSRCISSTTFIKPRSLSSKCSIRTVQAC